MTLGSFKTFIMISVILLIGVGLGALLTTGNNPSINVIADNLQPSAASTPSLSAKPAPSPAVEAVSGAQATNQYLGVTFARQSADIIAQAEGRVEAVYVSLGDHLKAGDVIARIESYSITQQLEMATASLRSTQAEEHSAAAELKEAEARYSRREELARAGVLSKEELATAKVQVEKARATLEAMRARVAEQLARIKQTKNSLAHTVVKAAFEGTVAARYLDPGATVHSGNPIISLMRSSDLWVRFAISEMQQAAMTTGAPISFHIEGLSVAIPGVIEHVSPGVAAISQEVIVEAKLNIPAAFSGQIKPGGSGLVSLDSASGRP